MIRINQVFRISLLVLASTLCVLTPLARAQQDWQAEANRDPVLRAMRTELERSKAKLKLEDVAPPYYIEYRVVDSDEYSAEAAYGALRSDGRARLRWVRVVVRIGDYKQDSYFGQQGEGSVNIVPLDDDVEALRHQLWLSTDAAYKSAAQALTAKQAQLKQLTIDQPVDDFARATPVQSVGPLVTLDIDFQPWTKMLRDASAFYKTDPEIEASESTLQFQAINRYFVNTEGTVVRSGQNYYEISLSGRTQAADGMSLERSQSFATTKISELPSAQDFTARGVKVAAELKQSREAPVVEEEYRGPVMFSPSASTTLFGELVGNNLLGERPNLGQNARTTKAFANSYKSRVLPDFLSVVDDPTLAVYNGKSLLGHYEIDDEGVPAQRVSLIGNGTLINYSIGREPIRDFPVSNGHGRARIPNFPPAPHTGNLIVNTSQPVSRDDLKKKFLDLCKQRDLQYGYLVEGLSSKLAPQVIYKVSVQDGTEQLVRGATLGDLDTRALRSDLVATGDDFYVRNRLLNVPHSIIAPSTLFDELEVKRAGANKEKLPEYPAPALGQ